MVESDEAKLFLGGVSWETTEEKLKDHFSKYGDVSQIQVMRDKVTGRPRGFAFVVFSDPLAVDNALRHSHTIDGRTVDAKRALSREDQQTSSRLGIINSGRGNCSTKKIFVGGLPSSLTEERFRDYFKSYGRVTDVVVMYDQLTSRPRGFGFVTFSSEDAVDKVLHKTFHELNGKLVEVKPAVPKDGNTAIGNVSGGYQGYVSNASAVDGRMDVSQYMLPQNSIGLMPYSGYGAFGFGAANAAIGYGGYGFGGLGGTYPNMSAPNGGFIFWGPGAFSNAWGSHGQSGFGASVYGVNAAYGPIAGHVGQSPSGASSGYRNQGNGPRSGGHGVYNWNAGNA